MIEKLRGKKDHLTVYTQHEIQNTDRNLGHNDGKSTIRNMDAVFLSAIDYEHHNSPKGQKDEFETARSLNDLLDP